MRKTLVPLLLASSAALMALDNSVTVHNASGSAQTNLPVTHGRYFAEGEIPSSFACARPYIDGTAATAWQCDRKNSWPDGSLKYAVLSYKVPSLDTGASVKVDFRGSASTSSGSGLGKASAGSLDWSAEIQYWFNKGTGDEFSGTISAKTMLAGLGESGCAVRKWLDGAVVTEFLIEDRCAGDSYDFGAQWDNNASKWVAAPSAAYKSLHPAFQVRIYPDYPTSGQYTVWARLVIENVWLDSRQNQVFSFELRGNGAVIESQNPYTMPHGSRFGFDGSANGNSIPAYVVDPNLPYLIYSKVIPAYETEPVVAGGAVIGKGGADNEINFQDNYGYLPQLGTYNSEPERPQYCRAVVNKCRNGSSCCAEWTKPLTSPGAGGELAPIPRFYVKWFYIARNPDIPVATKLAYWTGPVIGNAHAGTNAPAHFLDRATGVSFCPNLCVTQALKTVDVHGLPYSIDANPTKSLWTNLPNPYVIPSGCSSPQPCYPTTNGWSVQSQNDTTHIYSTAFVPYLLTGDWYWMTEMNYWSMLAADVQNPGDGGSIGRGGRLGYLNNNTAIRAQSWLLRNVAQGAALLPDGMPEQEYLKTVLDNTIAVEEGYNSLTTADGARFYNPAPECAEPCKTVPWRFGQDIIRKKNWDGSVTRTHLANPLHFMPKSPGGQMDPSQASDTTKTFSISSPWMETYQAVAMAMADDLGFHEIGGLHKLIASPSIQMILNPALNPFVIQTYQWPVAKLLGTRIAVSDASVSGTTITYTTATAHGFSTNDEVALCCTDWAGSWKYASGGARGVTVIDSTHFSITNSNYGSVSGSYPGGMYAIRASSAAGAYDYDAGYFQSWTDWYDAFQPGEKADASFRDTNVTNKDGGYGVLSAARLAMAAQFDLFSEGLSGRRAYGWLRANIPSLTMTFGGDATCSGSASYCQNPVWMIVPRPAIENLQVRAASNAILFRFRAPTGGQARIWLGTTPPGSTLDAGDATADCQNRLCVARLDAAPSTSYYYRITAGAMDGTARLSGTVTTPAAGAAIAYKLNLAPPAALAAHDVVVEYGATDSYGSSIPATACSSGCQVNIPATANTILYLRWSYRDNQAQTLATGHAARLAN